MNRKILAACPRLLLCLVCGSAHASLYPYSFGASETIAHDSNLDHADDSVRTADWFSTTELRAAMDQTIGRERLQAAAAVNYTDFRTHTERDAFGYRGSIELDWSTVGKLSGSLGADADRHQYTYGFNDAVGTSAGLNLETDNHVYAKASLGGIARWNIFAGFDASQRRYSAAVYAANAERQSSLTLGTTYATSPDLSFGVTGSYLRGEYPEYVDTSGRFGTRTISATTNWQASGNSALDASLGYTAQDGELQPTLHFVSGTLNWKWTPPSHFDINLGVSRSTNESALATDAGALNDRTLNTSADLDVSYALTAKISLMASAQYARRDYAGVTIPVFDGNSGAISTETVSGSNRTSRIALSAHYLPTRTTDLSCGAAHEVRTSGSAALVASTPNYTDNSVQCMASIRFD